MQGINGGISIIWNIWLQLLEIVQGRGGGGCLYTHDQSSSTGVLHMCTQTSRMGQDGAGWGCSNRMSTCQVLAARQRPETSWQE